MAPLQCARYGARATPGFEFALSGTGQKSVDFTGTGREWSFVIRRGTANSAVKAAAEFGRDNLKTNGSEIDADVLIAFVVRAPVCLRKLDGASLSAFRAGEAFGPVVTPGHSPKYAPAAGRIKPVFLSQSKLTRCPDPAGWASLLPRESPLCAAVAPRAAARERVTAHACRH